MGMPQQQKERCKFFLQHSLLYSRTKVRYRQLHSTIWSISLPVDDLLRLQQESKTSKRHENKQQYKSYDVDPQSDCSQFTWGLSNTNN